MGRRFVHCTVPYFGFKAKQSPATGLYSDHCTVPYFGFKAKRGRHRRERRGIVLCLILDSRQNTDATDFELTEIVLCLILDSRQNQCFAHDDISQLYCALFWIQGKTVETTVRGGKHCTVPYFGFKAKQLGSRSLVPTIVLCLILDSRQNPTISLALLPVNCTVPYFGFKAKLVPKKERRNFDCTVPYFGFKAKRRLSYTGKTPDCTVPYFGFKAKQGRPFRLR